MARSLRLKRMKQISPPPFFYKTIQDTEVPALGFGTYELKGKACREAVLKALEVGYRYIDTARAYENEAEVGAALKQSGIPRDEIFLTSKIWPDNLEPGRLKNEIRASLNCLETDHLDLVLIHWPNPKVSLEATIRALEEFAGAELIRHFGVSNFTPSLFREAIDCGPVFCNQVEYHPLLGQDEILSIARKHDVLVTAYSPLAKGEAISLDPLKAIARKYDKTSGQIALRWLIEQDHVAAIPRSSDPDHIESNFEVFDFHLDPEDRQLIEGLPKDQRLTDPSFAPDWEDGDS